ncbi:MAG: hypothetical protein U9R34_06575 [Nanoarchaeota archaeon]|nr:hypothetical protein [Nanoarchaeota archaeon]
MKKIIYKCLKCNKMLFFWQKHYFNNEVYCKSCRSLILNKEKREKEELKKKEDEIYKNQENARRAKLKNKLANEKLKIELQKEREKKEKEKQLEKDEKKEHRPVTEIKKDESQQHNKKQSRLIYFTKKEIEENDTLLFIYVNVKQIHAVEWLKGKKRVILNKKREVRRTHAGGFSAEKFQKFIDAKKQKTFEWVTDVLERQGVLKSSYDKIKISSQDDNLKRQLEEFLQKYLE